MDEGVNDAQREELDMNPSSGVLTIDQAADRIGVSPRTVRRMIQRRSIRHLRIGKLVRFHAPDVDKFIEDSVVEVA